MHNFQFINVMTQTASSGGFTVTLTTIDAQSNLVQTLAATGCDPAMSENELAYSLYQQFATQIIQYGINFQGMPVFTSNGIISSTAPNFGSQLGVASFSVTLSDHIICFFCEANFILEISNDTTGGNFIVSDEPLLTTVALVNRFAPTSGLVLETVQGVTLSTQQIIDLIQIASSKLVGILNNKISICTFVHEEVGYWQTSIFLRDGGGVPGVFFYGVRVKRANSIFLWGTLVGDSTSLVWDYKKSTGELNYISSQNLVSTYEPTSKGNEIKVAYVGGHFHIPRDIISGVLSYMSYLLENKADITSLKTGSWAVTFKEAPIVDRLRQELERYILLP